MKGKGLKLITFVIVSLYMAIAGLGAGWLAKESFTGTTMGMFVGIAFGVGLSSLVDAAVIRLKQ